LYNRHIFLGEKFEDLSLHIIQEKILKEDDYDNVVKKLTNYFLKTKNLKHMKYGMEFLYVNDDYRNLQFLIIKNKHTQKKSNQEWAKIYQMMIDASKKADLRLSIINQIQQFKTRDPDVEILLEFAFALVHLHSRNFKFLGSSIDKILLLKKNISSLLLLNCFNERIQQMKFYYYWKQNEVILARKMANELLKKPIHSRVKIRLHAHLGLTYIFDTYERGLYHLEKAYQIAKEVDAQKNLWILKNHTIPFYSARFGHTKGLQSEALCEQAHIEIVNGNKKRAIQLLNKMKNKTPFQYYYLGLATKRRLYLKKSYKIFLDKQNDLFFCRLPLEALRTMK